MRTKVAEMARHQDRRGLSAGAAEPGAAACERLLRMPGEVAAVGPAWRQGKAPVQAGPPEAGYVRLFWADGRKQRDSAAQAVCPDGVRRLRRQKGPRMTAATQILPYRLFGRVVLILYAIFCVTV